MISMALHIFNIQQKQFVYDRLLQFQAIAADMSKNQGIAPEISTIYVHEVRSFEILHEINIFRFKLAEWSKNKGWRCWRVLWFLKNNPTVRTGGPGAPCGVSKVVQG